MFVADSSVWIDFLAGREGREVALLESAIERVSRVLLCGPVLQEVLQGIRSDLEFHRQRVLLSRFRFLETTRWTYYRAASLYRLARRNGMTVNSFDTTITAVCLEHSVPLLTLNLRDFEPFARHAGLTLA